MIISFLCGFLSVAMKAAEKLHTDIIIKMREIIRDAEGREVLFVVRNDEDGLGREVFAAAKGSEDAAPALFPHMEKGDTVIHNHPSGTLKPSGNDLAVASRLGNQGIGFCIINNNVTRIYCVAEPVPGGRVKPLDKDELCSILLPGGLLSREFSDYEVRDSQVTMLENVIDAFNGDKIHAVEAGTGVGKSFAYIIPSLKWAELNRERVVISTATINLQQQLASKDIPLIKKITGSDVKTVMVKGRGNYICLRRLEDAYRQTEMFNDKSEEIGAVYAWSKTTDDGSLSDLSFVPDKSLWSSICSEADACMGMKCPMRERCFVIRMKKNAASANILIVNHHLLFSDLAMKSEGAGFDATAVLPPYRRVVFDEAHTIEKSATSFFSENYNKFTLFRNLNKLYGRKGRKSYGLIEQVRHLLSPSAKLDSVPGQTAVVRDKAELLEAAAGDFLGGESSRRLSQGGDEAENMLSAVYELHRELLNLVELVRDAAGDIFEELDDNTDLFELRVTLQRLQRICGILGSFRNFRDRDNYIFWTERKRTAGNDTFFSFFITPLDISDMMKTAVYDNLSTIIFASATLTIQKKFDYWAGRAGLLYGDSGRISFSRLKSPFEYRKQVFLGIPSDAPDPSDADFQRFISGAVGDILGISEGKALVLFTSYGMLKQTYAEVVPSLDRAGITSLKQGDDDRFRLLETFNSDVSSVLFATDSFWEGVDIPGDSLKIVIICRLPFRVPTDPIVKARMEKIELEGGNPFMELSLPEAAMRLHQGFGRLMRRKSDRGAVFILDPRIVRKSYGRILLSSLPESVVSIKGKSELLTDLEDFLYSE